MSLIGKAAPGSHVTNSIAALEQSAGMLKSHFQHIAPWRTFCRLPEFATEMGRRKPDMLRHQRHRNGLTKVGFDPSQNRFQLMPGNPSLYGQLGSSLTVA